MLGGIMRRGLLTLLAIAIGLGLWAAMFHDQSDAKDLRYIAWKLHLLPIDPHRLLETMHHDNPFPFTLGKTRPELEHTFGFVRTKDQVRPYLVDYCAASRPGQDVLFLNDSDWMVVMEDGKATYLLYCKG